jgi:small subunit ribosomal protein S2
MRELEDMIETGSISSFTKKEQLRLTREYDKLARNLSGLKDLDKAPDAVYILDTKKEEICVREARKLGIPIVAVLDTNCDPDEVDYAIPGNDDAIRSGALLTRVIADAVLEGKTMRPEDANAAPASGNGKAATPAEVLPGAAAEPKAEWELQLEAEEAAEQAQRISGETQAEKNAPADEGAPAPKVTKADDGKADAKGDEPGDLSHPAPKEGK